MAYIRIVNPPLIPNQYCNTQHRWGNGATHQTQTFTDLDRELEQTQVHRYTTLARKGAFYLYWGSYSTWRAAVGAPRGEWAGDW